MNLILDIGNTVAKIAVFDGDRMMDWCYDSNQTLDNLDDMVDRYHPCKGILATVVDLTPTVRKRLKQLPFGLIELNKDTPTPIINLYETPETLGYDRVAAVVGAHAMQAGKDLLVIDAGTCITYEFLDAKGCYHGGNISPGRQMRFNALQHFTAHLPLVKAEGRTEAYGKDTETAIRAGVQKGIEYEISGYIREMKSKYPSLFVFLTGGDEFSFDESIKSIIFADKFLVLEGLNRILNYNNGRI